MKFFYLILIFVLTLLLVGCSFNTTNNLNENLDDDSELLNQESTLEHSISEILNSNEDIQNILDNSNLRIQHFDVELFNEEHLNEPYYSLKQNVTFNDQLYIVEVNSDSKSYLTLVDLQQNKILKIYNLITAQLG
jgi:uncharacterized protein YcfL